MSTVDDDKMWTPDNPSRVGDERDDNPRVIANHVRALQAEVRSGFEMITQKVLDRLDRFEGKVDVLVDRQNVIERRQDAQDAAIAALGQRVAALEAVPPARTVRALPLKKRK